MSGKASWKLSGAAHTICIFIIASVTAAFGADDVRKPDGKSAQSGPSVSSTSSNRSDIDDLRRQLAEQQKQIEELRQLLQEQAKLNGYSGAKRQPAASAGSRVVGEVASMVPMVPPGAAVRPPAILPQPQKKEEGQEAAPLQLRIGNAYITPIGFMDLTSIWRSTAPGSGIGTNFGSIPYGNTTQGRLTDLRVSAQNSRIGSRVDANVKGAHVTAYWKSDFLGFVPANAAVSTNSDTFRLRLYWVDVKKGKWEIMGGQSWSMITPGRKGISPLPGDLFYSNAIDVNYHAGLTFSRDPQLRLVYHPSDVVAMGVSFESAEQYIGGSSGGGLITLPSALVTPYQSQLNNGGTTLTAPNLHPDIVAKIAFDPKLPNGRGLHIEVGGTARTFKVYNPLSNRDFTANGIGGQANLNLELLKGLRLVTNNYWSDGGGRWIFGQAPDLIVRGDGSLSPVHSGSTVSGFEFTKNNTLLYGYYGSVYIGRNVTTDTANGKFAGYGYTGSPGGQNRSIQQGTLGFTRTFWKDPKYGALSLMGQYSYLVRNPWSVASGQPKYAKEDIVYFNLRYALPGSAPTAK